MVKAVRQSYECLARVHYLNNAKVPCLHAALRALNLAELAGPSAELARSYGNASIVFGLMGWHGTAEGWARYAANDEKMAQWLADAESRRRR